MLATKLFRTKARGLPDLLNWAALVDDGVVQGKDGSLMAGYFYRGPDIASATPEERNHLTARVNAALARFGTGWATWHDAVRLPAATYPSPEANHFPDPVTALIDAERRVQFTTEGAHFESEYALVLAYTPPLRRTTRTVDLFYDDEETTGHTPEAPASRILAQFRRALEDFEDALGTVVRLRRMRGYRVTDARGREHLQDELVNYLRFCLTGESAPVHVPDAPMYLDAYLGAPELWPGDTPRVGDYYVCCVAIDGMPGESYPGILDVLDHLPVAYRWSTRMLYLDQHEALAGLRRYRRQWKQKQRGFAAQVFRTQGGVVNEDAVAMARQAEDALTDASSALVTFGYYTAVVVLTGRDRAALLEHARTLVREIGREGFGARVETVNAMEAWLGTLPGHPLPNIRRPLVHTLSLADLLPLASVWAGAATCPCPYYPPESPPLLHAATAGATPFRLNLHVGDVGHTAIFGPTGAGKSTLMVTLAASFRRYRGAKVTVFDKGRSALALCLAVGGQHYDLAGDTGSPGLAPLAHLDTEGDVAWAAEWLANCCELQTGHPPTPRQREEIHRALGLVRANAQGEGRSLTDFVATVQDDELRAALAAYTIDGPLGPLLDSRHDEVRDGAFQVFEIEDLMALGDRNLIPVLLYLFRRFEKSLTGAPALLELDEAWVMFKHPVFREKIREWLKVLRKANVAVVLATQSLTDAVNSGLLDVILEACATKILLPNVEAGKGGTAQVLGPRDFYTLFGLNDTQIGILESAAYKRHYYVLSAEGRRLFDLGLGPVARAFVAVSDKQQVARVRELARAYGPEWPGVWLREKGVDYEQYLSPDPIGGGRAAARVPAHA